MWLELYCRTDELKSYAKAHEKKKTACSILIGQDNFIDVDNYDWSSVTGSISGGIPCRCRAVLELLNLTDLMPPQSHTPWAVQGL